jgi:hypothetical protein
MQAQMMAKEYKNRGGDYNTPKSDKDESQQHLEKWGEEEWQTKEGSANAKNRDGSRKRYLPKKAWEEMSKDEKQETDAKKQKESQSGKQFVDNTPRAKRARKNANEKEDEDYAAKQNAVDEDDEVKRNDEAEEGKPDEKKEKKANQSKKRGRAEKEDVEEAEAEPPAKKQQKKGKAAGNDSGKTIGSKKDKASPPAKQASLDRLPKKGTQTYWKAMPGWVDGKVVEVLKKGKSIDGYVFQGRLPSNMLLSGPVLPNGGPLSAVAHRLTVLIHSKQVKASQDDPKVILKSNSSGKICVHKVDNVYFD